MNKSYIQLQKQIETLQKEAEKVRRAEVEGVIARIKEAIQTYGLTAEDLGFPARSARRGRPPKPNGTTPANSKAPRFRDTAGHVWSGRGPRPKWLREALASGRSLDEFAV